MAVELENSPLFEEIKRIQAQPGSPYWLINVVVHAGGKLIVPDQILRIDIHRDYRASSMDATSLVVSIGLGTLIHSISPYQDDLKLTLNVSAADEQARQYTDQGVSSRTYRAYLGDDVPRTAEAGNSPAMHDEETGNRASFRHVRFVLEEIAVEQLRKTSVGIIARSCPPYAVMQTLLVKACQALKLGKDEVITGFEMTPPNNTTSRTHVVIKDGTPILDVPDVLQNEQGGVYSTGLGFYIQGRCVYTWPLYDVTRQNSASKAIQILMAPNKYSRMLDKTWRLAGRTLTIYASGVTKVVDDSLGALNNEGNAVRFSSAGRLVEGFGEVSGNKVTVSRTKNNSEFATTVLGNGQNVARASGSATSNPYLEASRLAKRGGAIMVIPWPRSNPDLIVPGMSVEILFDQGGIIRTIEGAVLEAISSYELDGNGLAANRYTCKTVLSVFIDRNDPDYVAYLKGGGSASPTPQLGAL